MAEHTPGPWLGPAKEETIEYLGLQELLSAVDQEYIESAILDALRELGATVSGFRYQLDVYYASEEDGE